MSRNSDKLSSYFSTPVLLVIVGALLWLGGKLYEFQRDHGDKYYAVSEVKRKSSRISSTHIIASREKNCESAFAATNRHLCKSCMVKSQQCMKELPEKYQPTLQNLPVRAPYYSSERPLERHLVWGLSPAQTQSYCILMEKDVANGRCVVPR